MYTLLGFRSRYFLFPVFGSAAGDPRRYLRHWEETLPARKEHISILVAESLPPRPAVPIGLELTSRLADEGGAGGLQLGHLGDFYEAHPAGPL
jgi:hypothetical protein